MTDYRELIDAETWAFIRESESWYPPETASFSIAEQRAIYDRMCRAFHRSYPAGITAENRTIGGVACRAYSGGPGPVVIYYHGGGFVVGGLESHDDVCAEIAAATGLRVVSVDYRLSPEHPHPAAYQDALAVAKALRSEGNILLAGDSAGGNLAAAVAIALRGDAGVLGHVLIYPGLGGQRDSESFRVHAEAPMLTAADVDFYAGIRCPEGQPKHDPNLRPLDEASLEGLCPGVVFAAECDPLADDGALWVERLRASGVAGEFTREAGLVHGYLRARKTVGRARMSFSSICEAIRRLAGQAAEKA